MKTNRIRRIAAAERPQAPVSAVVQGGMLWEQHCSWCPRCHPTVAGCDLGRKAYGLYEWLERVALFQRRAG